MDNSRKESIDQGANLSGNSRNFNYVDTSKLERLGIDRYATKKPKGNNFIRIVTRDTSGPIAREIWQHSDVGSNRSTYLCMNRMYNKPCPVCEHMVELKKENADDPAIGDLVPRRRFLMFVVDTTSQDTEEEGPKWFDCPISIYRSICTLSKDKRTGETIDPADPEDGRDISFVRRDGNRTEYTGFEFEKTKPVPEGWYKDLPDFEDVLLIPKYDEVKVAVSGQVNSSKKEDESTEDEKVEEDGDEGRSRKRSGSRSRSSRGRGDGEEKSSRRSRRSDDSESKRESVRSRLKEIEDERKKKKEKEDE